MNARVIAAIPLVVVAAAVGVLAAPREALATRVFAKKEGKACSFCHVNPKGGGPRNPTGRDYEANGYAFAVKTWSTRHRSGSSSTNEQEMVTLPAHRTARVPRAAAPRRDRASVLWL